MRASLDLKEVSYQMGDQEDEEAQPKVKTEGVSIKDAVKRAEAMKVDHRANESAIAKREANQKELAEKKKQDMLDRVKATEMGAGMSSTPARTKKIMVLSIAPRKVGVPASCWNSIKASRSSWDCHC